MAEWDQGQNPFLIELVIDNMSKYLSFEELQICRELNHQWNNTTKKIFLKRCPPMVLNHNFRSARSDKRMSIPQFMEIYSDPTNHPHPHAQLLRQYRNFEVYTLGAGLMPAFYNFMTEIGPQMTSLELTNVQVLRNSQDLADIFSSKYTPNLEELTLEDLGEIVNYQHIDSKTSIEGKVNKHLRQLSLSSIKDIFKVQWLDVLSGYPKLNALYLFRIPVDVVEEIAAGFVSIRKANETKLRLAELDIFTVYPSGCAEAEDKASWERILDLLKTANLPLKNLGLDKSTREISSALIKHYEENVTSLTLKDGLLQPLPLLKALEDLDVTQNCLDLTFLTKVPNLKSLCFDPYPQHGLQTCFPESTPNPLLSLTKLDSGFWKKWNITEMEQLLLWMPNVQNLEMHLNNTTFPWICQHFPNLKELTVHGKDLDDSGLVGEFDEALEVEGCRPNITNLKALETFEMTGRSALTEKSVFYGFSLMPKLSKLILDVKSELSADAMLALDRIKNVQILVASK